MGGHRARGYPPAVFTGLVQAVGTVVSIVRVPIGMRLLVDTGGWGHAPGVGESISVGGCCLTVAGRVGGGLAFDVVPETMARTTLGRLAAGSRVNLEHSVTAATLMGGHIVQGHVDGVGEVLTTVRDGEHRVRVRPRRSDAMLGDLMQYITPKGSVVVDGVSLTVAAIGDDWFEVALIPTTLAQTTLGELREGSECNLETDVIAKTVVSWLRRYGPPGGAA